MASGIVGKSLSVNGYSNINYYIYEPENINKNTPIILYEHGAGGGGMNGDSVPLINKLDANGSNAIVLFYNRDLYRNFDASNLINAVSQEYGVPVDNYRCAAHSFGFTPAMTTTANLVQQHPNMNPQAIMMLDGYWPGSDFNKIDQAAQVLGTKGTVMFAVHQSGITCNDDTYQKWAGYGMNIFKIQNLSAKSRSHAGVNRSYVDNDLFAFHAGVGKFPDVHNEWLGKETSKESVMDAYTVSYFDAATGKRVPVDISGMTLEQVYNMCGIDGFSAKLSNLSALENVSTLGVTTTSVSSDSNILSGYLNEIISQVRSSAFLSQSGYDYGTTFSSTTNVPSQIPTVIKNYFSSTADLLQKIAYDTYQFANIGESYDDTDTAMTVEAETLGADTVLDVPLGTNLVNTENKEETLPSAVLGTVGMVSQLNSQGVTTEKTDVVEKIEETSIKQDTEKENKSKPAVNSPTKGNSTPVVNQTPTTSQNNEGQSSNSGPTVTQSTSSAPSEPAQNNTQPTENRDTAVEFPPFEELYSDENKVVYNYNDECKVIVYKEGDKVTGIEYYYDFKTNENAIQSIDTLLENFQGNPNFKEIMSNDRYVKVIMNESMYKDLSLSAVLSKYANLEKAIRL